MVELPTGTVTFLFTDLEGSTRLWEEQPDAMKDALARHDAILREAIEGHGGVVFSKMGDGIAAVFGSAPNALGGVLDAQRRLTSEDWDPTTGPLRARMGLHTDEGRLRAPGEYVNRPLNRCARLMGVGHGGQVLLSDATATVARDGLPTGAGLVDLGEHRLRDLGAPMRVFQLTHPDLVAAFPPLRSLDALPGNLPRQATTFVGRDEVITNIVGFLRDRTLVTLTGVGGVGKTRLAIQVAAELVSEFQDGAWLCALAPVGDPDAVWDAVASILGVYPSPGRRLEDSVLEYLAAKRLLLLLDNCEHLLDAAAQVVDVVSARCPRVVVLATSREGLAISGEQIVAVPSLGFPREDVSLEALEAADSVRLFVDRAHSAKSDFVLTDGNAGAVATLCRRLDGIPLAIELAAARVRSLTPDDLVARLDQRFRLLTRGSRAALDRHRTLRNTIDWSYDLLSETERDALNRLSVFAGGCDLAAAESVVAAGAIDELDVADVLGQLVEKSLVVVDEDEFGARYRLLETIRQYAQERLEAAGDVPELRRRHADHYVARAEAAGPHLRARGQIATARAAARDLDNFRAALDWAAEMSSAETALRLVAPLSVHGTVVGYASMDWAGIAVTLPGASEHALFPEVGSSAVVAATARGDLETAAALADAVEAAEASLGSHTVTACLSRATLEFFRGDLDEARRHAEAGIFLARPTNDPYELATALTMFGVAAGYTDPTVAVPALDEAVRIAREAGIASSLSTGLLALAVILPLDEAPRALALLDEAIEVGTTIGDRHAVYASTATKALRAAGSGEWRSALRASADASEQQVKFGGTTLLHPSLWAAAVALVGLGHPEPAAVLIGAADAKGPVGIRRPLEDWGIEMAGSTDAALLEVLGAERLAALRDRGAALEPADVVAYLRAEADRVLGDRPAT